MHALANAHANHIIFDLNIKYLLISFINIWVGYLNITKCIDKGFLVLQAFSSTYLTVKQKML